MRARSLPILLLLLGAPLRDHDLVHRLAAADPDTRDRLLSEERESLTVELRKALIRESDAARIKGDYPRALALLDVAGRVAETIDDREGAAVVLRARGAIHSRRGDYAEALEHFQKSLEMFEALGDRAGIAGTLHDTGVVHETRGDYPQAMDYYQRTLALREALGDRAGIAGTWNNMGIVHQSQGDYDQALESYRKSLALKEALGDRAGTSSTLNNLGLLHQVRGNYVLAVEHYQKSQALKEELGDKAGLARTLNNIGLLHHLQGHHGQAMEHHRRSLALKEALGDKPGIAASLVNIGRVHEAEGRYAEAMDHYQRSLVLKEALGDRSGIAIVLNNIGHVLEARGDHAQAADHYQRSLGVREALGDKAGTASALISIGALHQKQGRHTQALELASRGTSLARQIGGLDELWPSQLLAGRAHASLGDLAAAGQAFRDAVGTIEALRGQVAGTEQDAQRFFENKLSPYLALADVLVRQHRVGEALDYAERAKARVLLDVLHSGRVDITKAMTAEERAGERRLAASLVSLSSQSQREGRRSRPDPARLAALKTELQAARLAHEAFRTRLYATHPELRGRRGEAPPLQLEEAGHLLPDAASALLEYVVTEDQAYLFVLTKVPGDAGGKAQADVFPLAHAGKDLAERAARFRDQLAARDLSYQKAARELYDALLGPARHVLRGKRSLTIVPDGALWDVPFQALQPRPGRHLIEESTIAYAPSLTVLREMTRARGHTPSGAATLLAVGNPLLGGRTAERARARLLNEGLAPLQEAEEQVKELERLYGAGRSTVYVGAQAREERVKAAAGRFRVLHLATHGIADNTSPMYSQVVLAREDGAAGEDGLLEAWEIMNLDLNADLVVLSACETARGRVGAGEGMIGLAWAVFVAGAPSTVVSQWKVDAAGTTDLMLEFHRGLLRKSSKAAALRNASLKMLRGGPYRHPFYWAPFVLIGDAS
jgi:CHAT domain-containing protein/Tfp pilus assembly protein PilF